VPLGVNFAANVGFAFAQVSISFDLLPVCFTTGLDGFILGETDVEDLGAGADVEDLGAGAEEDGFGDGAVGAFDGVVFAGAD
jgi:hypothetical protein